MPVLPRPADSGLRGGYHGARRRRVAAAASEGSSRTLLAVVLQQARPAETSLEARAGSVRVQENCAAGAQPATQLKDGLSTLKILG